MQWTGLNEIREKFLSFFESKGHTRLPSFPLVPQGDKSLLLINSGMAPLKKYFLGQETPPSKRVTTCQKCIRTPDIERVGKTARHGTYFEMLGNFSFGDYFKHDATRWAWEFVTEVLEIPKDRLYVSIYLDDDEAYDIWTKEIGVDPEHMVRLGKADNFWEHGAGPCGPCSEIYFDRGPGKGCGSPDCKVGCDCDRYVEFWNLVFTQFNNDGADNYTPLEHPNIDTGMGLERLACILQEVDNLFEVDTVQNIMKHIRDIAGVAYGEDDKTDVSLRVVTDHIRSTTFMVADGIVPSNEGRGYVLRRLLRRAARHGRLLGIAKPFLYQVADTVIQENASAYPELVGKKEYIKKVIRMEEERFAKTIDQGMEKLNVILDQILGDALSDNRLSGEQAFMLYDTFGFPIDLVKEIIGEKDISLDEEAFNKLMDRQRELARSARAGAGADAWKKGLTLCLEKQTDFDGYGTMECCGTVVSIVKDNEEVDSAGMGDEVALILDRTPFYAESGGQVGDTGVIAVEGALFKVKNCVKSGSGHFLHIGEVAMGCFAVGDKAVAHVDEARRRAIMRNHTAAHLLQAALRNVLGEHVHQAGQLVDEHRVRFDFAHFSAMTAEEIAKVENEVNEKILDGIDLQICEMPIDEARKRGAMALFGEKYGDVVRVCSVGDYSVELCGGTHVGNTSRIGLFKIISESSVAAGVRRIEAATGFEVLALLQAANDTIAQSAAALKLNNPAELEPRCHSVMAELKAKNREIDELNRQIAGAQTEAILKNSKQVGGVRLITALLGEAKLDTLRTMADNARDRMPETVCILAGGTPEKMNFIVTCGKDAVALGAHAGKIAKAVATITGAGGGGRPDSAMAGVGDPYKIDMALAQAEEIVSGMLKA